MSADLKKDILEAAKGGKLLKNMGCEYCRPPFRHCGKYYISTGYANDPYLYTIRKEDSFGGAMIKYCPWCGRELDPYY